MLCFCKTKVEMELAAKQKELDFSTLQVKHEQKARLKIETKLEALKAHVKALEAKPLPILKDTESSLSRKKDKDKQRKRTGPSIDTPTPSGVKSPTPSGKWQKKRPSEDKEEYKPKLVCFSLSLSLSLSHHTPTKYFPTRCRTTQSISRWRRHWRRWIFQCP